MPRVFKKAITQHWVYDAWVGPDGLPCPQGTPEARFVKKRKVPARTPGATVVRKRSTNYYGRVPGRREPVPLCANKAASETMLADLIGKSALRERGLADPFEGPRKRPLREHVADFRQHMEGKGDDPRHVRQTIAHVEALLVGCDFRLPDDLDLSRAQEWLASLRQGYQAELPPDRQAFTLAEVADLLGVKSDSVAPLVKRSGLEATGKGKARRFPRATVEALLGRRGQGAGPETVNHYVRAVRSFCRWLVRPGRRLPFNPLDGLELLDARVEVRRARRELTADELRRLLDATRTSERSYRGLTGDDRFVLYATACGTGFRAGGLASLTPACFDLGGRVPIVILPARTDKSRRGKTQPLPADVAELLRDYLDGKDPEQPLWPGTWARDRKAAEMLRIDLEAAGIPYSVPGPDGPLYADFHALRHTYLTLGGRAGIDLRALQELAGHSSPNLTARYSHVRLHDLAGAVDRLPAFLPVDRPDDAELRATGTEGAAAANRRQTDGESGRKS